MFVFNCKTLQFLEQRQEKLNKKHNVEISELDNSFHIQKENWHQLVRVNSSNTDNEFLLCSYAGAVNLRQSQAVVSFLNKNVVVVVIIIIVNGVTNFPQLKLFMIIIMCMTVVHFSYQTNNLEYNNNKNVEPNPLKS